MSAPYDKGVNFQRGHAVIPLEWMAPLMFGGLIVFMLIGYPVAFSLAAIGLLFGFISIEIFKSLCKFICMIENVLN